MSWTLIESQTLSGTVASVTLGSGGTLPQTYKTLRLVVSARGDNSRNFYIQLNGSSAGFTWRSLAGNGTAASSGSGSTNQYAIPPMPATGDTTSTFSNTELTFPNYTSSAYKTFSGDGVTENNGSTAYAILTADLWSNTASITSITIQSDGNGIVANSSFSLYGLK